MNLLNGYLWTWKNWEAADVSFKQFNKFYSDGKLFLKMDVGGDEENLKRIADKWDATFSVNPLHVGRCGWMGHYENYEETGVELTRKCWPKESAFTWMDGVYEACLVSDSKYLIVMEDDTFILRPISILEKDFGISVFEYNTNVFPHVMLQVVHDLGGNIDIPRNKFNNKGYGAGGGFILNCKQFVSSWEKFKPILDLNWDTLVDASHLIGWVDFLPQITIMVGGYEVIQNPQMVQTWYHERPDLYPTYTHWKDYEIADFVKNIEDVRSI